MRIKKIYITGLISFICLTSGISIGNLFLKTLADSGWYGFSMSAVFIFTLIWSINYWFSFNQRIKSAKEAAKEAIADMLTSDPDLFRNGSPGVLRNQIENHLLNKIYEEHYVLW